MSKESVEEFLARGGEIEQVPVGQSGDKYKPKKTRKEARDMIRRMPVSKKCPNDIKPWYDE